MQAVGYMLYFSVKWVAAPPMFGTDFILPRPSCNYIIPYLRGQILTVGERQILDRSTVTE